MPTVKDPIKPLAESFVQTTTGHHHSHPGLFEADNPSHFLLKSKLNCPSDLGDHDLPNFKHHHHPRNHGAIDFETISLASHQGNFNIPGVIEDSDLATGFLNVASASNGMHYSSVGNLPIVGEKRLNVDRNGNLNGVYENEISLPHS